MGPARSRWFLPDRTPTWGDLLATALALTWAALTLATADRVAWPVFAAGAGVPLALGSLATTASAARLRRSIPALGVSGRTAVILAGVGAVWLVTRLVDIPAPVLFGLGTGIILGTGVVVVAQAAVAGAVDGWTR